MYLFVVAANTIHVTSQKKKNVISTSAKNTNRTTEMKFIINSALLDSDMELITNRCIYMYIYRALKWAWSHGPHFTNKLHKQMLLQATESFHPIGWKHLCHRFVNDNECCEKGPCLNGNTFKNSFNTTRFSFQWQKEDGTQIMQNAHFRLE